MVPTLTLEPCWAPIVGALFQLMVVSPQALANLMAVVQKLAPKIKDAMGAEGVLIQQFNGAAAGQTVPHFHLHLVPRSQGDGMALTWPVKNPPRERLAEYADRIRAKLG